MSKLKDITGFRFGSIVAIRPTIQRYRKFVVWECKCDCGNTIYVSSGALKSGGTKTCGCSRIAGKQGSRYGKLTLIKPTPKRSQRKVIWECKCDCGNIIEATHHSLVSGHKKTCGCFFHNKCYTVEYKAWAAMVYRCSESAKGYLRENYYGRGIRVYDGWIGKDGFIAFSNYMGQRPSKNHSIDRINNNGNYEPGNVRWADWHTQANNRRKVKALTKFSDEEMIQEMSRRGFGATKMK
jgi:hypothetical protein